MDATPFFSPLPSTPKALNRRKFLKTCAFLLGMCPVAGFAGTLRDDDSSRDSGALQPKISILIDDIGHNPERTRQFLDLGIPITFAVLPRLKYSHLLAREIHSRGYEVMLHQPMEPYNPHLDPGPGALYSTDNHDRICNTVLDNITRIPHVKGVNNHMGSRFTSQYEKVVPALQTIKRKALFFVDSVTTYRSVAYQAAQNLSLTSARRNIFLDHVPEVDAIIHQLRGLLGYALQYSQCLAIGHPYPQTLTALRWFIKRHPRVLNCLVPVSQTLTRRPVIPL